MLFSSTTVAYLRVAIVAESVGGGLRQTGVVAEQAGAEVALGAVAEEVDHAGIRRQILGDLDGGGGDIRAGRGAD